EGPELPWCQPWPALDANLRQEGTVEAYHTRSNRLSASKKAFSAISGDWLKGVPRTPFQLEIGSQSGGARRMPPKISDTRNRTINTTKRIHATCEETAATLKSPSAPAMSAMIRNVKAKPNISPSSQIELDTQGPTALPHELSG